MTVSRMTNKDYFGDNAGWSIGPARFWIRPKSLQHWAVILDPVYIVGPRISQSRKP